METKMEIENDLKEILKQVRRIDLRTRRLANDAFAGRFHSVFRGRGMDFDEVREYVPGDEVRTIDWNVTARAGHPFVKKYREERELTILLAVDVSASGDFGSTARTKREIEAEIASVLALSAVRNSDRVGLVLFSDQIESFVPPRKGRQHVLRLVREVLSCRPQRRGTDVARALEFVDRICKRRAMVFVLSDFQSAGEPTQGAAALRRALRLARRRHDVVALRVSDPRERELPDVGLLTVEDAETGELIELDSGSARVRERFAAQVRDREAELERTLRQESIDHVRIDTAQPYLPALVQLFGTRAGRRR
jgi:uncharacterized protein (DUF58 family)